MNSWDGLFAGLGFTRGGVCVLLDPGLITLELVGILGAVIGAVFVFALPNVRLVSFDPRKYFMYHGTSGPFEAIDDGGTPRTGRPISTIRPGESFAWISTLWLGKSVRARACIALRCKESNIVVSHENFEIARLGRDSSPRLFVMRIPVDAAPGRYSADRQDVFQPPHGWPIATDIPPLEIEVVAP